MRERLRRLFSPPIFGDEEKTRLSRFLTIFSQVAMVVVLLSLTIRFDAWSKENPFIIVTLAGFILFLLIIQYILKLGHIKSASILAVSGMWIVMTIIAVTSHGVRDLAVIFYFAILLLAGILLEWRPVFLFGLISLAVIWYLAVMEQLGLRPVRAYDTIHLALGLTANLVLIGVLIYLLITNWTRTLESARIELQERLRAEAKLQRQADFLTALHETALGLLNQSELLPLLRSILTRACTMLETQHGQISLVLPDESAIAQQVGHGIYAGNNGMRFKKGDGAVGSAWASGETLVVQDYQNWEGALPEFLKRGVKAIMGVPLKLGEQAIGVLAVSYVEEPRTFTIEQTHFMERFADMASLAIHNMRLYEQLQNELNGRKVIESALRASEERFRKVFEASPVAICITTLEEGRLIEANDAFWKISGFDPHTAIGRTARELNMVESGEKRREFVERLQREGSMYLPEDIFLTPQAEQRIAQAFYQIIEIRGQTCILTMLYDVTKQRQDQLALEAAEARTRALLVAVPDMIIEVTRSGVITDFIPSSAIGVLMPSNQYLGKNLHELLPEKAVSQAMFAINRALETDQLHAFEYGVTGQGDAQFFEARVAAISESAALMMVREISQRKWIESEREKLITELEAKNAELERFTYAVSHDLKSPLITIRGFLGFVEQDALRGDASRLKGDIQRIDEAVARMQSLLNELLELSRVGRLMNPYELVPFDEIAREAVNLVQGRLMNMQVEVDIQKNPPVVYGDRRRLVEVAQNLVDNAAKFLGDQPNPRIEIGHAGELEGQPVLFVRDNGI